MLRCVAVALCSLVFASSAVAQVIYEPVRSQYQTPRGETYYYGGVDPRVHAVAGPEFCRGYTYGRNLHNFDGGNTFNQPSPMHDRAAVFSDCIPFRNAADFGYTPADAANEANANAPTYFRKADLLASAIVTPTGALIVPASAPHYLVAPRHHGHRYPASRTTTSPAGTRPGQVIIIPKRLMDKKVKDVQGEKPLKVASAK